MTIPIYRAALIPLIEAFQALGIAYHIGGSVAGATHGVARATLDRHTKQGKPGGLPCNPARAGNLPVLENAPCPPAG